MVFWLSLPVTVSMQDDPSNLLEFVRLNFSAKRLEGSPGAFGVGRARHSSPRPENIQWSINGNEMFFRGDRFFVGNDEILTTS
jgi:hypothetical protein